MIDQFFAVALGLAPVVWHVTLVSEIAFLVMLGLASANGDFKGVIESSLAKLLGKE